MTFCGIAAKVLDTEIFPQHTICHYWPSIWHYIYCFFLCQVKPSRWKEINTHIKAHTHTHTHTRTHTWTHRENSLLIYRHYRHDTIQQNMFEPAFAWVKIELAFTWSKLRKETFEEGVFKYSSKGTRMTPYYISHFILVLL